MAIYLMFSSWIKHFTRDLKKMALVSASSFMVLCHRDAFARREWATVDLLDPSHPYSSFSSACVSFPASGGLHCAIWEAEHCAHKVAQGDLRGLQLTGAVVPCVNSGVQTSQRSLGSRCPVQLWEWAACLCSSMWLSRELAITPIGAGLQGLQNKAEAATSMGFSPVPAEHSANFMDLTVPWGLF